MRFGCTQCNAKYSIADEKVHGKILRIRCKKCGQIIEVRDQAPPTSLSSAEPPRPATRAAAAAAGRSASVPGLDDDFERAFGRVVAGQEPVPGDSDKTVLFEYTRDVMESARPGPGAPPPPLPVEWYLAVDGRQSGPLAIEELRLRLGATVGAERVYVWHDGMAEWARAAEVEELVPYLPAAAEPPAPVIEAAAVAAGQGVALVASPEGKAAAAAPGAGEAARLDIHFDEAPAAGPGAEPVRISAKGKADDLDLAAVLPSVARAHERRVPVGTWAAMGLVLVAGVLLLLGALDVIYIPFVSSEREVGAGRGGQPPATAPQAPLLGRDPLLDRETTRIVVQQAPPERPKPNGKRAVKRPGPAEAPPPPAATAVPPPAAAPTPPGPAAPETPAGPSELEKRVYGGAGGVSGPRVPEHLMAKSAAPVAASQGLSQEVITEVIRKYRGGIQNCYEKQIRKDAKVKGRLTLNLKISKNGRVQGAGVEASMRGTLIGKCVVRLAKTWRFPPSGGEVEVDYPLILEPTQ
jgi:predicted Zn finger-like uncharacterized protein